MTAIETRFIGPTNTKGARVKAIATGTGDTVILPWDHAIDTLPNHQRAARALAEFKNWTVHTSGGHYGPWHVGDNGPKGYIFVCCMSYAAGGF